MRIVTLLVMFLSVAAACKKEGGGEAVARMTGFRDRMCACKDRACLDQVTADLSKSAEANAGATAKLSAEEQSKLATLSSEIAACVGKLAAAGMPDGAGGSAAGSAGSAADSGSAAAGSGDGTVMARQAGMCPSTVFGATTKAAMKGNAVVITVESADKDAIVAIQKRAESLLAEKRDAPTGGTHDQKGSYGGARGLCPVYVPDGATATTKSEASGAVITITPKDKPDELAKEIESRIAKAADWVKTNVKAGEQGTQGGVGGGKGEDGSNHSGKGDGKGRERKSGEGGGAGTGGGGGKGTGGGGGKGTGGGSAAAGSAAAGGW